MEKRCDLANNNIMVLIDELIDARKEALGDGNCPYYSCEDGKPCRNKESVECFGCIEDYFEEMRQELLDKYLV